jgi:hypothetical protein
MSTYLELYNQIKSLESVFKVPANYVTVDVGTFDASTGSFTGLTTETETDPEPIEHRPGDRPRNPPPRFQGENWVSVTVDSRWRTTITQTPAPKVGLAPVVLKFSVVNQGNATCMVTIGAYTASSTAPDGSVLFNIWDLPVANWQITCAGRSYSDRIMIQRDTRPVVGMGAFTVPALPLAIVYAPPCDAEARSKMTYSQSKIVGTTSSLQVSSDSSSSKPWLPFELASLDTLKTALDLTATGLNQINSAEAKAVATALGQISTRIIGTVSGSETSGSVNSFQQTITLTVTRNQTIHAEAANGGTGDGDSIHYLRDAKFAWFLAGGKMRISLLGGIKASYPAKYLAEHAADPQTTGMPQEVTGALLALDPFVGSSPGVTLPTPRFEDISAEVYGGPLEYGGGQTITGFYSKTYMVTNTRTGTNYASRVQDFNPGVVAKIFGAEARTLRMSSTATRAAGTTQTDTQTYNWELHSGPDEHFIVEFWIDHLFGTLAPRQQLASGAPRLKGSARSLTNRPLANQPVFLRVGNKTYRTVTDANGNYAFYANTIPRGEGTIQVGSEPSRPVTIGPRLRAPRRTGTG